MDSFTLVASIVLLGFIAWALARILGGRDHARRDDTGPDAGSAASWSGSGGRRDPDHGTDSGHGDGGGDGGGND